MFKYVLLSLALVSSIGLNACNTGCFSWARRRPVPAPIAPETPRATRDSVATQAAVDVDLDRPVTALEDRYLQSTAVANSVFYPITRSQNPVKQEIALEMETIATRRREIYASGEFDEESRLEDAELSAREKELRDEFDRLNRRK